MKRWLRWLGIYLLVSMLLSLALSSWIRHNFRAPITYIGFEAPEGFSKLAMNSAFAPGPLDVGAPRPGIL